jgi:hypothetical protein
MKIRPERAELFNADGQTDVHNDASSRFSQFCERSEKFYVMSIYCSYVFSKYLSVGRVA